MNKPITNIIGAVLLLCFSNFAAATLFDVTFTDNDGPQWTGAVDSNTDSLVIQTWAEGAGGTGYWTPSTLPLSFTAYQCPVFNCTFAQLNLFDVADNWDGTIGADWGFLSDITKDNISWNEGVFTANTSRLGWGIAQTNSGIITSNFGTESSFSFVPFGADSNVVATADTVTVTVSSSVPKPATLALFGLALAGIGISRKKKIS
ncbi:MAG: PEP-CTERM sorting domain-containing protein [Motiliproteus sp.]